MTFSERRKEESFTKLAEAGTNSRIKKPFGGLQLQDFVFLAFNILKTAGVARKGTECGFISSDCFVYVFANAIHAQKWIFRVGCRRLNKNTLWKLKTPSELKVTDVTERWRLFNFFHMPFWRELLKFCELPELILVIFWQPYSFSFSSHSPKTYWIVKKKLHSSLSISSPSFDRFTSHFCPGLKWNKRIHLFEIWIIFIE